MDCPNIEQLRQFYMTPLGGIACRSIRERIHEMWPEVGCGAKLAEPEYIGCVGYAAPYVMPMLESVDEKTDSYRMIAILPKAIGEMNWPKGKMNRSILVRESELPFEDESLDRLLVIHSIENCDDVKGMLRELWRVLKANGKMIAIVPNRSGLWSQAERTPFGHGKPFSPNQIKKLLADSMFLPQRVETGLFLPPTNYGIVLKSAKVIEKFGKKICKPFGGILVAEAEKQLYAPTPELLRQKQTKLATAID